MNAVKKSEIETYSDTKHPTHKRIRSSMSSCYDMICDDCGKTDYGPGSWGLLRLPCDEEKEVECY